VRKQQRLQQTLCSSVLVIRFPMSAGLAPVGSDVREKRGVSGGGGSTAVGRIESLTKISYPIAGARCLCCAAGSMSDSEASSISESHLALMRTT